MRRLLTLIVLALTLSTLAAAPVAAGGGGDDGPSLDEPSGRGTPEKTAGYREILKLAIADIQAYWADQFPQVYGFEYEPIPRRRIFAAEPGIKLPRCQGVRLTYSDARDNAFYCYEDNYIAYDDVDLFPRFNRDYGNVSIAFIMAHEWGHAIQDRAENDDQPTILKELQADCFAGSWVKHVNDGQSTRLELEGGDLDRGLTALLRLRDPVGTSAGDEGAHGNAFDRVSAFTEGFTNGAGTCVPFFETPPVITEVPFTDEQDAASGGNLPPEEVIPAAVDLLNDFYAQVEPATFQPFALDDLVEFDASDEETVPECNGPVDVADVDNRVFYCIPDQYVGYDLPYLQDIYEEIGDTGVWVLLAHAWGVRAQDQAGLDASTDAAVFAADCQTGGFLAAYYQNQLLLDDTGTPAYLMSPGDLDETVQALVDYSSARGVDTTTGTTADLTFRRVQAMRDGFLNGYQVCPAYLTSG